MQEEFERLERSACTYKSMHDGYKNLYHLNYSLQPHERCMHGGIEPAVDEKISFRGKPLETCFAEKQPVGTYVEMYHIEKIDPNPKRRYLNASTKAKCSGNFGFR